MTHTGRNSRTARLLNLLSLVSLVLCVGAAALDILSFQFRDVYVFIGDRRTLVLASSKGQALIAIHSYAQKAPDNGIYHDRTPAFAVDDRKNLDVEAAHHKGGFGFQNDAKTDQSGMRYTRLVLTAPYWFPCLVFSTLPLFRAVRQRIARWRFVPGHCANCGYDLRASAQRCPECGMVIPEVRHP